MLSRFFNRPHRNSPTALWFAGVYITSCCRRLEAALVGIHSSGTDSLVEIGHGLAFDLPESIRQEYCAKWLPNFGVKRNNGGIDNGLSKPGKDAAIPSLHGGMTPRLRTKARNLLADIQEETIRELLPLANVAPSELIAIGVHDPGVWFVEDFPDTDVSKSPRTGDMENQVRRLCSLKPVFCEPLSDTTALATRTGYNVFDAFPAMDLSVGGQGGPFLPLSYWAMLHSQERHRLLLDLGQEARITFLPNSSGGYKSQIGYGSAGACGSLIDPIVQALTNGEQSCDDGGRLAIQGEKLPDFYEFLTRWEGLDVPATPSHWSPLAPFLAAKQVSEIFGQVHLKNRSLRDVLCAVIESVACRTARAVRMQFGPMLADAELIITGGGRQHGVLMKKLLQELGCDQEKVVLPENIGFDPGILDASAVAVLTSLAINQIPCNLPHLTGAETDCVLGRIIPGSPQNWQKLIQLMATVKPAVRSLRSAV